MYPFIGVSFNKIRGFVHARQGQSGTFHAFAVKDKHRLVILYRDDAPQTVEIEAAFAGQHLHFLICIDKERIVHLYLHRLGIHGLSRTVPMRIETIVPLALKR